MREGRQDYSHRSVVDKLGVRAGHAVAFEERAGPVDEELRREVEERAVRSPATESGPADVVLVTANAATDVVAVLKKWRARIRPNGGIWVLTPKKGQPGYVKQTDLIPAGAEAGLVDNKTCSVSTATSGMRFVIRRADRS